MFASVASTRFNLCHTCAQHPNTQVETPFQMDLCCDCCLTKKPTALCLVSHQDEGFNLSRTQAAIERYDAIDELFFFNSRRDSFEEAMARMRSLDIAAEAVGAAYGLDTLGLNNYLTCRQCVRPGTLSSQGGTNEALVRRLAREWKELSRPLIG